MEGEFQDWELLHCSDTALANSPPSNLEEIEDGTVMIRSDYFSPDNKSMYHGDRADDASEDRCIESDSSSWIDPGLETGYGRKHSSELWSDSSSGRSEDRKLGDFDVKSEMGFGDTRKNYVAVKEYAERQEDLREYGEIQVQDKELGKCWSDSAGYRLDFVESGVIEKESENLFGDSIKKEVESAVSVELVCGNDSSEEVKVGEENSGGRESLAITPSDKSGITGDKKGIVLWKIPFELLKYCVFKVSPVWSFSLAAAVMGIVILGRRLYKMKKKSRSLQLKVTVDDKKVSQFMSHAARLNEAFSVMRRVPIIRPALRAPGVNQWTLMSLR